MISDPGELTRPGPESIDRMHREVAAFLSEQAIIGASDLTEIGFPEVPDVDAVGPYDNEEGPEDVEPGRVVSAEEMTIEDLLAEEMPDTGSDPPALKVLRRPPKPVRAAKRPATPRPQPRGRGGRPLRTDTWRDKAARDSGSDRKPWPYGSKEE